MAEPLEMSVREILDLPALVPLRTAGRALGLNESTAYRLAASKDGFPCRVVKVGKRTKVPRAALMELLGISEDLRAIRQGTQAGAA